MKVAVVTPSIGSKHLLQCVESVQNQTYEDMTHYIFLDGNQYSEEVMQTLNKVQGLPKRPIRTISLEENIGKSWYGHRVYAACSFLVNADVICYLDEDNWYEPTHIESMVKKLDQGNDWVYSLRKIFDVESNYLLNDDCESLGKWPVYFNPEVYHIDTSCFAVRRDVAVQIGHSWYGQWGADRQFFGAIKKYFPKYECTNEYTSCYRLDGNENSVKLDFFEKGNAIHKEKYNTEFPWKTEKNKLLSVGPGISIII